MSAVTYTGHGAKTGGLQQHSVGDDYPMMVVGTHHRLQVKPHVRCEDTRYYVLNLVTGERHYIKDHDGGRTFMDCGVAHEVARQIKAGRVPDWITGGVMRR